MHEVSEQILNHYQVRKTKKQKLDFRRFLMSELSKQGYGPKEEKIKTSTNIVIGNMDTSDILFTAHYDTCTMLPFPNLIIPNSLLGFILSQGLIIFYFLISSFILSGILYLFFYFIGFETNTFYISILLFTIWVYFGKANTHTANDNTSGVITVIEAALKMPEELRDRVCFILFDNEEKGLLGSNALAKKRRI